MQIIVEPPAGTTVWWYMPRKTAQQWYIQAMRPRLRNGEVEGVEYCILAHLDGTTLRRSTRRYCVTPYCNIPSRYVRVFSANQTTEAIRHTRFVASLAYRLAIGPRPQLWWHQWSNHLDDKLEPLHAH